MHFKSLRVQLGRVERGGGREVSYIVTRFLAFVTTDLCLVDMYIYTKYIYRPIVNARATPVCKKKKQGSSMEEVGLTFCLKWIYLQCTTFN